MRLLSSYPGLEDTPVGRLYQRYWLPLFTAIRQHIPSLEDAEDILLDVFLAAIENAALPGMSEQHQEAWLRRVAYNKCMDFHRHTTRHPALPLEGNTEKLHDEHHLTPEQVLLRQEELAGLYEHLASLPIAQQEILRLRFAGELPFTQIAAHMHKSEGAVRTMLSRSLNLLRDIYAQRREGNHYD